MWRNWLLGNRSLPRHDFDPEFVEYRRREDGSFGLNVGNQFLVFGVVVAKVSDGKNAPLCYICYEIQKLRKQTLENSFCPNDPSYCHNYQYNESCQNILVKKKTRKNNNNCKQTIVKVRTAVPMAIILCFVNPDPGEFKLFDIAEEMPKTRLFNDSNHPLTSGSKTFHGFRLIID